MSRTAVFIRVSTSHRKTDTHKAEMTLWQKQHRSAKVQWFEVPDSGTTMQRDTGHVSRPYMASLTRSSAAQRMPPGGLSISVMA